MRNVRRAIIAAGVGATVLYFGGLCRAEDDVNNKNGTPPASPSSNIESTWGTGSDTAQPTLPQPYQQTQQQPAQQPLPPPPSTTTYSTTTTTAATYDDRASADRAGYYYRPNRPLLATGLGIFGLSYGASAVVGATSDREEDRRLLIPVVGPWLDLAQRDCSLGECGQQEDWNHALLIGSGVLQGIGVGLSIAALFVTEERGETYRVSKRPTVRLAPVGVRSGGGIGAVGTF